MSVPPALARLASALSDPAVRGGLANRSPTFGGSRSAVLVLLSDAQDPTVVFTERARTLRHHGGQVSFPGGRAEPGDPDALSTATREAREEVGLDPRAVHLIATLPMSTLAVSQFDVIPVVGWWHPDRELEPVDPREVASVRIWPVSALADPRNRVRARHPGRTLGPAWQLDELFIWGFTAFLTQTLLRLGGWESPWDEDRVVDVPPRFRSPERQDQSPA
ncbi:NUDIX domain-containing protein [Propionibacterium cyclohexanicum]|uniref:NUDIX domain-containing protein n=1 Tax=Propionibacterium cyclohexanicum TaxID=64702 RepID=A0A1H9TC73_9ACTN|nr:CoA pyrophosphatase [Propionibacterium cyclohexanicum]SER94845.1 NUDIX domain-containing protein [Propionibacterium cyclohexanicum]